MRRIITGLLNCRTISSQILHTRMSSLRIALPLVVLFTFFFQAHAAAPPPSQVQFKQWYPGIRGYMEHNLNHQCAENPTNYYNVSYPYEDCQQCRGQALIDCLLNNLDAITTANLASAAVILGLLPSTLSLVGLSYVETGVLAQRRPFLAFLLATGSPAVSPLRTFDYRDPSEILRQHTALMAYQQPRLSRLILVLEYLTAFAAIANLSVVTWQLCVRTICSFTTDTFWMPILWPVLAILIHIVAMVAVRLQWRFDERPVAQASGVHASPKSGWIQRELSLCSQHPRMDFKRNEESLTFLIVAWVVSTGTVLHILLGTLVFSSLLFIETGDAISVVAQYLASTLVCRVVLVYELAGLRTKVDVQANVPNNRPQAVSVNVRQALTT